MGESPVAALPPPAGTARHPGGLVQGTPSATLAFVALRTVLLVTAAIAGILVLLPAALGAVATGPLPAA